MQEHSVLTTFSMIRLRIFMNLTFSIITLCLESTDVCIAYSCALCYNLNKVYYLLPFSTNKEIFGNLRVINNVCFLKLAILFY